MAYMISAKQSRMARAGLGWTVRDLARHAKVAPSTIVRLETEAGETAPETLLKIQRCFEDNGLEFLRPPREGVRFTSRS
jgi:DNA-binding XRE family transcriptional regulator